MLPKIIFLAGLYVTVQFKVTIFIRPDNFVTGHSQHRLSALGFHSICFLVHNNEVFDLQPLTTYVKLKHKTLFFT